MATIQQTHHQPSLLLGVGAAQLRRVLTWLRFRLAWLAGGDMRLLQEVPGEKPFHDRLGGLVLVTTALSGVAMCYLASVVRGQTMADVWFVGLIWWLVLLNVEPLLLDLVGASGRGLVAVLPLRGIVTLILAGLFAEALLVGFFKPEIRNVLGQQDVVLIQQAQTHTLAVYEPKIKNAQATIAALQQREAAVVNKITDYTFLARCEAGQVQCSQSHRLGCGMDAPYCKRDLSRAAAAKSELNAVKPRDAQRIKSLNAEIAQWEKDEQTIPSLRSSEIKRAHGLIEREQALWKIETHSGIAAVEIWSVRAALIVFDLLALGIKLGHLPASTYKLYAAAARRREGLAAFEIETETEVAKERIRVAAEMQVEIDRACIEGDAIRRIAEEEAKWWPDARENVYAGSASEE